MSEIKTENDSNKPSFNKTKLIVLFVTWILFLLLIVFGIIIYTKGQESQRQKGEQGDGLNRCATFVGGGSIYDFDYYENTYYMLHGGKTIYRSDSGDTWTPISMPTDSGFKFDDKVLYFEIFNGKIFTAQSNGTVKESVYVYDIKTNTWKRETVGGYIHQIKEVNGQLVALTNANKAVNNGYNLFVRRENGNWQGVTIMNGSKILDSSLHDICYAGGRYTVVGSNGAIASTTNLLGNWTYYASYADEKYNFESIMHDGTCYVLGIMDDTETNNLILSGRDLSVLYPAIVNSNGGVQRVRAFECFDGKIYACAFAGDNSKGELLVSSNNGLTWNVMVDDYKPMKALKTIGSKLYIGGTSEIYYLEKS